MLSSTPQAQQAWFQKSLVGMEVGPTGAQFGSDPTDVAYASRFNGREIVQQCVKAGSEYVVIWARDGEYAYYDSKHQPKAPGLGKRDVLRESVEEAKRLKTPLIAYCVLQYPTQALRQHPEWRAIDREGRPIGSLVCFNSPYREYIKRLLAEMIAYGIDGFHLDMVDQGFGGATGCWCANCQREFQQSHGRPLPKPTPWEKEWDTVLEFRYQTSQRFERDLYAYVRSVNPQVTVDFNYHGSPPFSWEVGQRPVQHANNSDFVTGETGAWGFSALTVGLSAEFYRASTPGIPFQVAMQRGVRMYHDQTTRPLADIRWELFTLLSHGAFVTMVDKTGFDGWLDPLAYNRIGEAFHEVRKKREHFGQAPVAEVGIWFSSRTRDWVARDKPQNYFQPFQGAQKALVYEHIPYGVVLDENATLQSLQKFPVVCLPNVGILNAKEVALLRAYVEDGGNLLVLGLSGCYDSFGNLQKHTTLEPLIGAKFVSKLDSLDNHVRLAKADLSGEYAILGQGIPADWTFLVKGYAGIFKPTTAHALGELFQPYRSVLQRQGKEGTDWPQSAEKPVGGGLFVNRLGKGKVLTITASPDYATASEHAISEARLLLRNAVRYLHRTPKITIEAPATVEAVVSDDAETRTLRIHLLGYNAPPQTIPLKDRPFVLPAVIEEAPLFRVKVNCAFEPREVKAWNRTTNLKRKKSTIEATVNDVHEVLIVRY
jgi:hypothetical protein